MQSDKIFDEYLPNKSRFMVKEKKIASKFTSDLDTIFSLIEKIITHSD